MLAGYVAFSLVVLGLLVLLHLPELVVAGYLVIAGVGFLMVVRDIRARSRAEFAKDMGAAMDRIAAQTAANQDASRTQPWHDEVNAAQNAAVMHGGPPFGIYTSFNPYWTLSLDSLVGYGLTTREQIAAVKAMVRDEPPESWRNGFILSDLTASGLSRDDALVRIGLYMTNEDRRPEEIRADRSLSGSRPAR